MIKNATIYRLPAPWAITAEELIGHLTPQAFAPCTALDFQTLGWIPPREHGQPVHSVNRQFLLRLQSEKKILPNNAINHVTKARAAELEEQQGFPPGRKQTKELKELVINELLPRALSTHRSMLVWIDPVNGWLVCDAASPSRAEEALKLLLKAIPKFPLETLRTVRSPLASMTDWLASDEAPSGFTVDQETELRATGEGKATVRFTRHTLELDDTRRHIEGGKQCTRLAMTWRDKISFILTANMTIKRIVPLDVLKEDVDITSRSDDERFDGNVVLMTGELAQMFDDLVMALGGEIAESSNNTEAGK